MKKHTPGPWKVAKDIHETGRLFVETTDENVIATLGQSSVTFINRQEDAHLIAAAPELLEVCEKLLAHAYGNTVQGDFLQDAEIAIAKAKGEKWATK